MQQTPQQDVRGNSIRGVAVLQRLKQCNADLPTCVREDRGECLLGPSFVSWLLTPRRGFEYIARTLLCTMRPVGRMTVDPTRHYTANHERAGRF